MLKIRNAYKSVIRNFQKNLFRKRHFPSVPMKRYEAIRFMETAYFAAATSLIWVALYYLPIGGALFRLALPLPLALLQIRHGSSSGLKGLSLTVLLVAVLMGPVRGPLFLFPYGLIAIWLGWSWGSRKSWWISWGLGTLIGAFGFLVRVFILSILVGENLWVVITRAGAGILEGFLRLLNLSASPDLFKVQMAALALVLIQEVIYVFVLHAVAYWIFPRLKSTIPDPPQILNGIVALDPL